VIRFRLPTLVGVVFLRCRAAAPWGAARGRACLNAGEDTEVLGKKEPRAGLRGSEDRSSVVVEEQSSLIRPNPYQRPAFLLIVVGRCEHCDATLNIASSRVGADGTSGGARDGNIHLIKIGSAATE
jgi:hypothetical protein